MKTDVFSEWTNTHTYWNTAVNDFENVKTKSLKFILCLFKNSPK